MSNIFLIVSNIMVIVIDILLDQIKYHYIVIGVMGIIYIIIYIYIIHLMGIVNQQT